MSGPGYTKEAHDDAARDWWNDLWLSIHGPHQMNPDVVALSFRVENLNIDRIAE